MKNDTQKYGLPQTGNSELRLGKHGQMDDVAVLLFPWRLGFQSVLSPLCLPSDLTALEYLRRYCFVCSRRQNYYNKSFDKFDRDRDGILSLKVTRQNPDGGLLAHTAHP